MDYEKIITSVLPALITAFVSTIAMITSYKASKNAQKQSYNNNVVCVLLKKKKLQTRLLKKQQFFLPSAIRMY